MSKMFDALRRAESERRRKLANEPLATPSSFPARGPERSEPASRPDPAPAVVPVLPHAPRPTAPQVTPAPERGDPFPGEMLRELGILRNAIEARLEKKSKRVLMFTSAMHGEGVTTLAVAYARLLSMHGTERILLVELNARTPALASRLELTRPEGVTHYCRSGRDFVSLAQRPAREHFDVVHVGEPDAALIQINLEQAIPHLLQEALSVYDTVIVDAPPVVLCPETPPLAPHVDGVALVVLTGRTKRDSVQRSIKQIQQSQGRVLGVVLNRKRYYIPDFIYRRL